MHDVAGLVLCPGVGSSERLVPDVGSNWGDVTVSVVSSTAGRADDGAIG